MFKRARRAVVLATAGTAVLTVALPAVSAQAYSVGNYYKLVDYYNGTCGDISGYPDYLSIDTCARALAHRNGCWRAVRVARTSSITSSTAAA
jgi:hypothetical protein